MDNGKGKIFREKNNNNNNDDNEKVDDKNDENKMNLLNKTKQPTRKD